MIFERFSVLHKSRRLLTFFWLLILFNIFIFVFPILIFVGDDIVTSISFFDLNFFWIFYLIYVLLLLFATRSHLSGNKKQAKYLYDVLLIIMISKLLAILYRMWNLIVFFENNPYDNVNVILGPYVLILIGVIVLAGIVRYSYSGIERRNSVYYFKWRLIFKMSFYL